MAVEPHDQVAHLVRAVILLLLAVVGQVVPSHEAFQILEPRGRLGREADHRRLARSTEPAPDGFPAGDSIVLGGQHDGAPELGEEKPPERLDRRPGGRIGPAELEIPEPGAAFELKAEIVRQDARLVELVEPVDQPIGPDLVDAERRPPLVAIVVAEIDGLPGHVLILVPEIQGLRRLRSGKNSPSAPGRRSSITVPQDTVSGSARYMFTTSAQVRWPVA